MINKNTLIIWTAMICAGIGGALYGYDVGVISGALVFIKHSIILTRRETEIIVGAVFMGGLIGTMISGSLADRYGRRTIILVACLVFTLGIIFILISHHFFTLLLARLFLGIAVGIISVAVPLYLAEIAPANLRGRSVTLFQIFLTLGILIAYVVDYLLTPSGNWRGMFAVILIPSTILFISMLLLPETPRWLIAKGKVEKARHILKKIRESVIIESEISAASEFSTHTKSSWKTLIKPCFLPATLLALFIVISNQLTGVNIILQYAPMVIQKSGMNSNTATMLATVGIGIIQFIFTLFALMLVDKLGRKFLLAVGTAGLVIADIFLGFITHHFAVRDTQAMYSLIGLIAYIAFYGIGPGVVVWLVISELLPTKVRGKAISLCLFFSSLSAGLLASGFLTIVHNIGLSSTYYLFAFFTFLYFLAAYFLLPETKGKSLEAIQEAYESN